MDKKTSGIRYPILSNSTISVVAHLDQRGVRVYVERGAFIPASLFNEAYDRSNDGDIRPVSRGPVTIKFDDLGDEDGVHMAVLIHARRGDINHVLYPDELREIADKVGLAMEAWASYQPDIDEPTQHLNGAAKPVQLDS